MRLPLSRASVPLFLAALLSVSATAALYLGLASVIAGELGYPLDDAWIHQTYARNLAEFGEWSFVRGVPSAGSTSPLWTLVLGASYWLPGDPRLWSYALGLLGLLGTAWAAGRLSLTLFGDAALSRWTAGAVLLEWHLNWAALSGMEILLYSFLALLLLTLVLGRTRLAHAGGTPLRTLRLTGRPVLWGAIAGLLTLARPEGLWLVALLGLVLLLDDTSHSWSQRVGRAALYTAGWLVVTAPALLVNWNLTGRLFPNTFYAKQQEYRILIETIPFWRRLLGEAWLPWIGGQALFLLGAGWLLLGVARGWAAPTGKRRESVDVSDQAPVLHAAPGTIAPAVLLFVPALWALGLIALYALRLPVSYQHGRYVMPIVPVALVYGLWLFGRFVRDLPRVFSRALTISGVLLFVLFWLRGGLAYAQDSAIITCEMVGTARWVAQNTEATDLIAAHDIGALGYFANRPLLDLAGLVSPEVIPILRDEPALLALMQERGVKYALFFPDWYPALAADPRLRPVAQGDCPATRAAGQASLAIYITQWAASD